MSLKLFGPCAQGEPDMREVAGGRDAGPEEQAHQTDGRAQSHARAGPRGQVSTPLAFLLEGR